MALFSARGPLFRSAAVLFSIAALFGVMRFSGFHGAATPHTFMSMITGVSAFPAMAASVMFPNSSTAEKWQSTLSFLLMFAVVGALIVMTSKSRVYLDACAVLSVLGITYVSLRNHRWIPLLSAALVSVGLLCFTLKVSPVALLRPADVLHLSLAAGWLGLSRQP